MTDKKIIAAEMQNIQTYFECKADMSIGNGKMKLLSWANAVRDALELLKEQEPVEPSVDVDTYVCPNCGHRLEHQGKLGDNVIFDERYNFCPACGKAVKWDEQ